jgi:acyl-coenzyme A synthetase/AMP-(fatty) acid ligase
VPRRFDFTDDLPRTPTGKMVKGNLRARYLDDPAGPVGQQRSVP